ncbi:hypothetical protein A2230_06410 [candidate division WOR-1 bacterium RIFOXYA2_FULL_36_21]|uniref:SLH domain-containing protein n=1 Tax=candidate division WOR-1 bacterium RIFOXYB2_FULL_36_35 TaxID=1802578 RepID=A0A1F4S3C6_UNCSA|nr:MAG: hypothetical protein A2230_06410 [candidate division WOR-1 bacterium RIFOXYA2_FULL_36_21]OGC14889.1 MAG: hypothetical protein A2290_07310 [candidate division WOR-1 bacterium RIFOXYB2_FULL_36_35]
MEKSKKFMSRIFDNKLGDEKMRKIKFSIAWMVVFLLCLISLPVFAAQDMIVADPMYIGVGARPLGMGKAYVAVAEDGDTVFVNPAGLGKVLTPKLTSMYTSLLGDVNYVVLGGAYPQTKNSAIGVGAIIASSPDIILSDSNGTKLGSGTWGSSLFFLSYGIDLINSNIQLGGSLKYFSQGGTGDSSIENANSTGIGFDIGALYAVSDKLSLGVSAQNPLGTKLTSGNGIENTVPYLIKVGGAYKTSMYDDRKLTLACDVDIVDNRPLTLHVGAELGLTQNITIRAGLDQNPIPNSEIQNNPTLGMGLSVSGMEFNYAYHPYGNIAEDSTHYFSLSYVGDKYIEEETFGIVIYEPKDKSIIYDDKVAVSGSAEGFKTVSVNGITVSVNNDGTFNANVPIGNVGKKLIEVTAAKDDGEKLSESIRVLRLVGFKDVPQSYWAKRPIEGSSTVGLVEGYPDGTFKPERTLSRAELATLLVRASGTEVTERPRSKVFKDVDPSHWAAPYIKEAIAMGLVQGYPDGNFRPNNKISKAEAITVLARYDRLPLEKVEQKPFSDVAVDNWAAKYVQAAKNAGVLSYVKKGSLGVKQDVTRAEAIEMMSKTSMAGALIKELFSWEKGFRLKKEKPMIKASL